MQKLLETIHRAERIVLTTHVHPDGDAIGSTLALHLALKELGKDVSTYLKDGIPPVFEYLEHVHLLKSEELSEDADLCILLDCADASRPGFSQAVRGYGRAGKLAFVDHHPFGDLHGQSVAYYHKTKTSSTAELVFELLKELRSKINPAIATALLTGIYTDTGGFQYTNTGSETMEAASELMNRGGKLRKIVESISHQKSVATLKLTGLALERAHLGWGGRCTTSVITFTDMTALGATPDDVTGVINELNVLPGTLFAMLLVEHQPGEIRGSLRTSEDSTFNVSRLAKAVGGGGHPRASGFTVHGHLEKSPTGWRIVPNLVS